MLKINYIQVVCIKNIGLYPRVISGRKYFVDEWWWNDNHQFDRIPIWENGIMIEWYPPNIFIDMNEYREKQINKIIE